MARSTERLDPEASLRLSDGLELLDTIDKLRALGIDKEVPLPQIVVVGQQSSGKSSVLEAISGVAFPINDGLCTRFATEVVLRRAPAVSTSVRIVRKSNAVYDCDPYQQRIDNFHKDVEAMNALGVDKLPEIVARASKCLSPNSDANISEDLLRIEVTGPDQDHLTLVDLPGIFYYTKPGQNADAPIIVKELALKYMSGKSIILAVISGRVEYCTQEILQTLKTVDASGSRTMGIITGLDQVERFSKTEAEYLALVENDTMPLTLGWHALRNPSFQERGKPNLDRQALEEHFFETKEPWSTIEHRCRGADQLKQKLSRVLMEHVGRELNEVVATLEQKIEDYASVLRKCGVERRTPQQKRTYLSAIGDQYYTLVKAALEGPYKDSFFALTGERLRARVRQESEDFAYVMAASGHRWNILSADVPKDLLPAPDIANQARTIGDRFSITKGKAFPHTITQKDYVLKVGNVLRKYRAQELQGTFDPLLVSVLFRDQSCRWRSLSEEFSRTIGGIVSRFIARLTEHLTESRRTRSLVMERLRPALLVREREMQVRLNEILKPFERSNPATYNPLLLDYASMGKVYTWAELDIDPENLPQDIDLHACQVLMNAMQSYYHIALPAFVDNVATLGIELCLLDGLEDLFSGITIAGMSDAEISRLASESPEDLLHRRTTEKRLDVLRAGREVCQRYNLPELQADSPTILVDTAINQLAESPKALVSRPKTPTRQPGNKTDLEVTLISARSSNSNSGSKTRSDMSIAASTPECTPSQLGVSPATKMNKSLSPQSSSKSENMASFSLPSDDDQSS